MKEVTNYLELVDLESNNEYNKTEFIAFEKKLTTALAKIKTPDHKLRGYAFLTLNQ